MLVAFVTQITKQMRPVNFIIQQDYHGFGNESGSMNSVNKVQKKNKKNLSGMLKILFYGECSGTTFYHQAAIHQTHFLVYKIQLRLAVACVVGGANHTCSRMVQMQV